MDTLEQRERRNQIRVVLRGDLQGSMQRFQGRKCHVIKDPITLRYYRFNEREQFLLGLLDGQHTLEEMQRKFEVQFRPSRLTTEELERFVQQVVTAGLAQNPRAPAGRRLLKRRQDGIRGKRLAALANVLAIQVPLFDPDRLLTRLLPWTRWVFAPWFFTLSVVGVLGAVLFVAIHFDTFRGRLPGYQEFFRFQTLACIGLVLGLVKTIHELGHGLSCKLFGGEVHEMGLMLLGFTPCMYCDVSDAWTLPSKWHRLIVSFAGIYVELVIAALATLVWWNTPGQPFLNNISLSLMIVCSVSTVIFNGNPLMRFDGYYVLADWIEVPNFAERSRRLLTNAFLGLSLGIRSRPEGYISAWRRRLMLLYALTSLVYRWVMALAVLWLVTTFLRSYNLAGIAAVLASLTIGSMIGWPAYRCVRFFANQGGRVPEMQPQRLALSAAAGGVLLLAFFLVPLPLSRVRQVGLVQVQPDALANVFVQVGGTLQKLHVRDGQQVGQGDVLAEFRNFDLENQRNAVLNMPELQALQLRAGRDRAGTDGPELPKTAGEQARADREIDLMNRLVGRLELRAPRAGVVMGAPPIDEVGKRWRENFTEPFCTVGDPAHLWLLVPLGPADYRLLRQDCKAAQARGAELDVTVLVPGRAGHTRIGKIAQLPESETREIPPALTQHAGGPIAAQPAKSGPALVPQTQQYLVAVALDNADGALIPGELAHVVIYCRWRTAAWWVWRFLSVSLN
jgi:putative peptide zinc metalloprotease protein